MNMQNIMLRKCANIKSKKQPDIQCNSLAIQGDFCSRHSKNPIRFLSISNKNNINTIYSQIHSQAAKKIQVFWKKLSGFLRYRRQGPAANFLSISQNSTEVYSLESIDKIPSIYVFSYCDINKNVWVFDIRSLVCIIKEEQNPLNPYTRDIVSPSALGKIQKRIDWLRKRNYSILYPQGENLTKEQIWNQKCLDIFMKMESFGYKINIKWFDSMNIIQHEEFYRKLYTLWNVSLNLSDSEKENIINGYNSPSLKLFKTCPERLQGGSKDIHWWKKTNLALISDFLFRASDKSTQALGAVYILMALARVISEVAEIYPWIMETIL